MSRRIDTQAEIDWVRLTDQVGDPASPAAGYKYFYAKAGGLYAVNSAGAVVGPFVMTTVATDPIFDAAGDIVQGTGANTAGRLAIGTVNQILRVNSGATALEYVSAGRVLINEATPTNTTVTWDSISNIYSSLEIEFIGRTDKASVTSETGYLYFNNDTTAGNYFRHSLSASDTTVTSGDSASANCLQFCANNAPANNASSGIIKINFYKSTTFHKKALIYQAFRLDADTEYFNPHIITWENAAAISRIDIVTQAGGNFVAGSTFRLYGVF